MKSTTLALASLLTSTVVAGSYAHQHHHAARHQEKRDQEVVWVTNYDYVTETVAITETIWVSEGFVPPTSAFSSEVPNTSSSSTSVASAAQAFQSKPVTSSSSLSSASASSSVPSSSTYMESASTQQASAANPSPVVVAQPITTSSVYVPPPVPTSSPTSAIEVPSSTSTTEAPAPVTPSAVPVSTSTAPTTTSGGVCSSSNPCSGDITYYEAGLGACGWTNDGEVENVIALPWQLMGTQSNGNPYCGRTVSIKHNGATISAKVVDKCMACTGYSIDLSNSAFGKLAALDVGRTQAEWWFTD